MNTKNIPFEIKGVDESTGQFKGHAAIFGNVDRVGDIILPGAFKDTLPRFLESGIVAWQHDWSTPIGKPIEAHEDAKGLFIVGTISDTVAGRDARTLMKDGVVRKMSIGYDILDAEKLTSANIDRYVNSKEVPPKDLETAFRWGFVLKKLELFEVSPVSVPANPDADITGVKGGSGGRPLIDHSVAALGAARDWIKRLEDVRNLRSEKGLDLGEELMARVKEMLESLDDAKTRLAALLEGEDEIAPDTETQEKALQLHAQFHDITRRILGA